MRRRRRAMRLAASRSLWQGTRRVLGTGQRGGDPRRASSRAPLVAARTARAARAADRRVVAASSGTSKRVGSDGARSWKARSARGDLARAPPARAARRRPAARPSTKRVTRQACSARQASTAGAMPERGRAPRSRRARRRGRCPSSSCPCRRSRTTHVRAAEARAEVAVGDPAAERARLARQRAELGLEAASMTARRAARMVCP